MTQSLEDYLEMVSFLADKGPVRVTDIAAQLGFSKPSVLAALKILEDRGLITHERYGPVGLTPKGEELAAEIRERHNLIKKFLIKKLMVDAAIAEKDACKMEHVLSPETMQKMRDVMTE
ncbi:MAG: metal-dependent transcriptional regulator [Spirochaetaceae bacterium]|jgi:DtxR family Mn-dependent transcriptional regulator|nr:metal-dependent transcriptional regulator [Spirochaetaceae bacterium]